MAVVPMDSCFNVLKPQKYGQVVKHSSHKTRLALSVKKGSTGNPATLVEIVLKGWAQFLKINN